MSWLAPFPTDRIAAEPTLLSPFLREVYTRSRCFGTFTWDPPNVAANTTVDTTLTTSTVAVLEGLRAGMPVVVTPPSAVDAGILWGAWVPADDQLTIRLHNVTGSGVDMASGTWSYMGVIA